VFGRGRVVLAELGEHAAHRLGVDEADQLAARAPARPGIKQLKALRRESIQRDLDVLDAVGDVVDPATALGEEAGDPGVRTGGPSSSIRDSPTSNITVSTPSDSTTSRWDGPTPKSWV
jgi:hypothetical protein